MDLDLQVAIAASFLSPYWQARVESSPDEFILAFSDSYLHCMPLYPEGRIKASTLARRLRKRLGERVSIHVNDERRWATVRLSSVTAETTRSSAGRGRSRRYRADFTEYRSWQRRRSANGA